jgi:hypothetical protein
MPALSALIEFDAIDIYYRLGMAYSLTDLRILKTNAG